MKQSEIEEGKEYAVALSGLGHYARRHERARVRVVEKNVPGELTHTSYGYSRRGFTGQRVEFLNSRERGYPSWKKGDVEVVPSRLFTGPWDEYAALRRQDEEAEKEREAASKAGYVRAEHVADRLRTLGISREDAFIPTFDPRTVDEDGKPEPSFKIERETRFDVEPCVTMNLEAAEELLYAIGDD